MLSIVIPVLNEQESLPALHAEIDEVARERGLEIEVIFVDDGSTDGSWRVIEELAERDERVQGIRFRRNFGKAAALSAGFAQAGGELVMTLDADLQDNPHEIPKFLDAIDNDLDVVSGWKQVRHDPWHKVFPSRVFNRMVSKLTGVHLHDHNCGMKCYRQEALREVRLYGELHRFVPVLAAARGFRVGEVVIRHRPRQFGHSKYGVHRFVKGFLDLLTVRFLTGFGQRPQHLLGVAGLVCFAFGVLGLGYVAAETTLQNWFAMSLGVFNVDRAFLGSLALVLLGAQFLSLGLVAELVIATNDRAANAYSISAVTPSVVERGDSLAGFERPRREPIGPASRATHLP